MLDTEIHVGASFILKKSAYNVRELFTRIFEENPDASREELYELFCEAIKIREGFQETVNWYFVVNAYESMTRERYRPAKKTREAEINQKTDEILGKITFKILEMIMPNGKPLGDCTGAEVGKFGTAYLKLERRVPKTKTVRSVLDENQVRRILS